MIIKVKKCVANIVRYEETDNGIVKVEEAVTIQGKRITLPTVERQIPRAAKLISWGYIEDSYEVDADALTKFCEENGKKLESAEA